ncbi:MAG TPA: DegT/DnrJ/EryC1/StrS family aminotransferase [Thermoanaerobaculia bacterium]|nr:DegT/DnrJ/EryC1/StrS family aminotransferase [Thermoanaerobaculia bacterium]
MTGAAAARPRVAFGALGPDYRSKRQAIDAAIARVLSRGCFVLGEEVRAFEEAFAKFLGVEHVVGCASGTEAIALALQAAGLSRGDEVLLPANTCVPTLAGVRLAGGQPRLADVDPKTLTLDAENAARALSLATRFLLPVHLYGGLADLDGLAALAAERRLTLVEDCAQSHGALLRGRAAGSFGAAAAFSFYPSKNLGAYGDAGAVATNDAALAGRLRELRQYGWSRRDVAEREGWNSRLDELQAAILSAKLPSLAAENARRRTIAARYDAALAGLPLRRVEFRSGSVPSRHIYPVLLPGRDAFREHLLARGVETGVHYPVPLHLQPAYSFLGGRPGDFPVAEEACSTEVSLPIHPALSDSDVETVIAAARSFFDAGAGR